MKIARFSYKGSTYIGIVGSDGLRQVSGDIYGEWSPGSTVFSPQDVKILAPVQPSKIICVGLNYRAHAAEFSQQLPKEPVIFLKPPTALIGPEDWIIYPAISQRVDYEAELAVIIRKTARKISPADAPSYILGYTCANDVTARDLQMSDGQWTRGKSFDTFCPVGPVIETDLDPGNLKVEGLLNGEVKQSASTSLMIFSVPELISFISQVMTLLPGDVVLTGTPSGVGPMYPGDTFEVRIQGIGSLRNTVRSPEEG